MSSEVLSPRGPEGVCAMPVSRVHGCCRPWGLGCRRHSNACLCLRVFLRKAPCLSLGPSPSSPHPCEVSSFIPSYKRSGLKLPEAMIQHPQRLRVRAGGGSRSPRPAAPASQDRDRRGWVGVVRTTSYRLNEKHQCFPTSKCREKPLEAWLREL